MEEEKSEEEIVAKSGESGLYGNSEDSDPWANGEIKHLKAKWLKQELEEGDAISDKELEASCLIPSLSRGRISTSARFSHSRSSHSSYGHSTQEKITDIELAAHEREPLEEAFISSLAGVSSNSKIRDEKDRRQSLIEYFDILAHLALFGILGPIIADMCHQGWCRAWPDIETTHRSVGGKYVWGSRVRAPRRSNTGDWVSVDRSFIPIKIFWTEVFRWETSQVLIRYGLEVLFDDVLSVTHESTIVYRDLPANVVGSFFMGWVGIVFKEHICSISEPLALGLSTGLMGSITTYAGWNQKMVVLLTSGNAAASLAGLLLGMSAAVTSLLAGIDSAKGVQLSMAAQKPVHEEMSNKQVPVNLHCGKRSSTMTAAAAACSWGAALILLIWGRSSLDLRVLWFACLVAPVGVWLRWHLARLNGRGVHGRLKWLPLGTLLANLIGAGLEGILALLQFMLTNDTADLLLEGLQLGFIGCLSTVSTFVAEVYTMHVGRKQSKAYIYTFLTLILGFILCIFLYSVPSWALGYVKW